MRRPAGLPALIGLPFQALVRVGGSTVTPAADEETTCGWWSPAPPGTWAPTWSAGWWRAATGCGCCSTARPGPWRASTSNRSQGDVLDPESLRAAFAGAEIVYHLAGVVSIQGDAGGLVPAVNVTGADNAARAALECGVRRFVHCSSVHALDMAAGQGPLDETAPRVPPGSRRHAPYDLLQGRGGAAGAGADRPGPRRRHRAPHRGHRPVRLRAVPHGAGVPPPAPGHLARPGRRGLRLRGRARRGRGDGGRGRARRHRGVLPAGGSLLRGGRPRRRGGGDHRAAPRPAHPAVLGGPARGPGAAPGGGGHPQRTAVHRRIARAPCRWAAWWTTPRRPRDLGFAPVRSPRAWPTSTAGSPPRGCSPPARPSPRRRRGRDEEAG